jgi:hypothetical protein
MCQVHFSFTTVTLIKPSTYRTTEESDGSGMDKKQFLFCKFILSDIENISEILGEIISYHADLVRVILLNDVTLLRNFVKVHFGSEVLTEVIM